MLGTLQTPMAPPSASSSSRWRRFALSAAFLCAAFFLLVSLVPPLPPPALSLDAPACRWVPTIEVCSHQLRGSSAPSGSLDAMTALWRAGVTCFDVDVTLLEGDGAALLTHPVRLAAATRGSSPSTLAEARAAGADPVSFPAAEDAVHRFADLLEARAAGADPVSFPAAEDAVHRFADLLATSDPSPARPPRACEPARARRRSPRHPRRAHALPGPQGRRHVPRDGATHRRRRRVARRRTARVGVRVRRISRRIRRGRPRVGFVAAVPRVQIGLGRRDVEPAHGDVARALAAEQLRGVSAVVASAAFDLAWYEAAARTGSGSSRGPSTARARASGRRARVSAFITDEPVESRGTLRDVRRACEDAFGPDGQRPGFGGEAADGVRRRRDAP